MGDLGAGRGTVLSKLTTLRWTSMFLGFCNVVLFLSGAVLLVSLPSGCSGVDRLALVVLALVAAVRIAYMVAAGRAQQATAETIVSNVLETSVDADALIRHERRCSTGSDVLRWRSVLEEDEVYSVARLLGDLVAYRASGTGHFELLAGLALLQKHKQSPLVHTDFVEAPEVYLQEAAVFHQFAEAAYTGPLLDFGRNPILFPCAWLYRQGVLSPWTRNRRPMLDGDNWWRGHAAAFLKYVSMPPEALRRGRVSQTKREAAYFVLVIHDLKSVVIAVRGTETPEDLITDGLCRHCTLSMDDLDGIINSDQLPQTVKDSVLSSFPHYGHSGIVEYAQELAMQIDGQPVDKDELQPNKSGFLSSLMGIGCECYGYKLRIVGHSLGGAVATMLGLRFYARYPNLHVIIYNDEFSARLSVNSILRLRAAAIGAISNDSTSDSAMVAKIVRKVLHAKKSQQKTIDHDASAPSLEQGTETIKDGNHACKKNHLKYTIKGGVFLCGHAVSCMVNMPNHNPGSHIINDTKTPAGGTSEINGASVEVPHAFAAKSRQPDRQIYQDDTCFFDEPSSGFPHEGFNAFNQSDLSEATVFENSDNLFHFDDRLSPIVDDPLSHVHDSEGRSIEMYIPGLLIHIVRVQKSNSPMWKSWIVNDSEYDYKAFVANKESFKDIVVSSYMFLDHLPWSCDRFGLNQSYLIGRSGTVRSDVSTPYTASYFLVIATVRASSNGESCNLDKDEAEILKPSSSSSSSSSSSPSPSPPPAPPSPPSLCLKPPQELPVPEMPENSGNAAAAAAADSGAALSFERKISKEAPPLRYINRCSSCQKRVGLTGFRCRCGDLFCASHRYSDTHDCSFDYKAAGREQIAKANPLIRAAKIIKI
ncbi:hypothetical protein MUK42_18956 [Musa troglodytarum]|uniref:AN1-type domain-containing protein n=1 Tax=Musa troglodytarum TaxID=320322 RepID=A0A9E7FY69_9LILI|nr:hypothetical protein MUK42_18956 [Musa troglodytarum]URE04550.1 hypothetical protein MUK42_18956 [Musa troglodytarum]URE04555.1 hypothetical protein MUK42_18956 [Musa troglodytarum]